MKYYEILYKYDEILWKYYENTMKYYDMQYSFSMKYYPVWFSHEPHKMLRQIPSPKTIRLRLGKSPSRFLHLALDGATNSRGCLAVYSGYIVINSGFIVMNSE